MEAVSNVVNIDYKDKIIVRAVLDGAKEMNGVKFCTIPTDLIILDPPYQRGEMGNAGRIAHEWDNRKSKVVIVSLRNWKFYCVDGANRVRAALMLGQETVNCILYEGLTQEDEAVLFATQDDNKRKVSSGQKFNALLEGNNPIAKDIANICDEFGVKYKNVYVGAVGAISSMNAVARVFKTCGADGLRWVFKVIRDAGWHTAKNAYSDTIINTLCNVYGTCSIEKAANILKLNSPDMTIRRAMVVFPDRGRKRATMAYIEMLFSK